MKTFKKKKIQIIYIIIQLLVKNNLLLHNRFSIVNINFLQHQVIIKTFGKFVICVYKYMYYI